MRKITLLLLTLLITSISGAQPKIKEKAILKAGAEATHECYVTFTREKERYKNIVIENSTGQPMVISADSVFEITFVESKEVFVSRGYVMNNAINRMPKLYSVVYKKLVEGRISLFMGHDAFGREAMYAKKNNNLILIHARKRMIGVVSGLEIISEVVDASQVSFLFFDNCLKDYGALKYSDKKKIQKNVKSYNLCFNDQSYFATRRKLTRAIGFTSGFAKSTVKYDDKEIVATPYGYPALTPPGKTDYSKLANEKVSDTSLPTGLTLSLYSVKNKHLSVDASLLLSSFEYKSVAQKYNIKSTNVHIPVVQKYSFSLGKKTQPFIGIGVNPVISVTSQYKSDPVALSFKTEPGYISISNVNVPRVTSVSVPVFRKKEFTPGQVRPLLAVGLDHFSPSGKVNITYRIDFFGSISNSRYYGSKVTENTITFSFAPGYVSTKNK